MKHKKTPKTRNPVAYALMLHNKGKNILRPKKGKGSYVRRAGGRRAISPFDQSLATPNQSELSKMLSGQIPYTKKVLNIKETAEYCGISKSTINRLREVNGWRKFPLPIKLSERRIGFIVDELDEWISSEIKNNKKYKVLDLFLRKGGG